MPPILALLLMIVSGWVHRRQLDVIELLKAESRMLKERLRGKRNWFTDAERALLVTVRRTQLPNPKNWDLRGVKRYLEYRPVRYAA